MIPWTEEMFGQRILGQRLMVRFLDAQNGKVSQNFGPYPFVQLTYELLRVGPNGDDLARFTDGCWYLLERVEDGIVEYQVDGEPWTDIVISCGRASAAPADERILPLILDEETPAWELA